MYYIFLFYRKNILYVILAAELYLHCQKECYHVVHRQHCRYPYFNTGVHYTMKKRKITSVFLALGLFASLLFQVPISAEEADQSAAVEASGTISTNSISGWPQASDISSEAAVVMENTTNTILYSKNADEVLFPGSTVKIMTCFLALENTQLTDEVTMTATGVSGVTDGGASISSQVDDNQTDDYHSGQLPRQQPAVYTD